MPLTRDQMKTVVLERHLHRVWSEFRMAESTCTIVSFQDHINRNKYNGLSCEPHASLRSPNTSSMRLALRRRLGASEDMCIQLQPAMSVRHECDRTNDVRCDEVRKRSWKKMEMEGFDCLDYSRWLTHTLGLFQVQILSCLILATAEPR